jgi:hypothetical protein
MGPASGSAKSAPLNKEKGFSPGSFEKRLHGMTNLTGSIFEKQGRGVFSSARFLTRDCRKGG